MCIATRCTTVDQFVEMFHRFVDEDSFFVSTVNTRPPGLETSFSVQLANGTPVLRGLCVVLQAWTTAASPFKTPGVRLGIKRLTANSMPVFERLLVTRSKSPPTTPVPAAPRSEATEEIVAPKFSDTLPTKVVARAPAPAPALAPASPAAAPAPAPAPAPPDVSRPDVVARPSPDDVDQRTPGSDLVLPANPLMNLTDESLKGYVDCTLYEETGTFFPVDDEGKLIDDLVPPPTPAMLAPRPVGRISTPVEIVAEPAAGDEPELTFERPQPEERRDATPIPLPPPTPPPTPMPPPPRASVPVIVGPARESTPAGEITERSRPSSKRGWLVAGAVLAAAGGVVLWQAMKTGNDAANASPPPTPKAQVVTPPPDEVVIEKPVADVAPEPPPTDEDVVPAEPELDTGATPSAGEGPCRVVVASTPAGSSVVLDGKVMAPSPVTIATTCERHKIDIKHPRYQQVTKYVALTADTPGNVEVTLQRPTHAVSVKSEPPGATIFINGNRAGTTPTVLSVLGFSNLKLEVKKSGYAPASRKLYSKVRRDKVVVKLTKW